jgi:tRNA(Ile)-lysidine synthase TilS/MesJ
MNLFHKGEFCSMLPKMEMKKFNMTIIRPLIYVEEEKIKSFAKQKGFLRITCQCPVGQNSYRKKTDKLIEIVEEIYPNVRQNLLYSALQYGSTKANKD